MSDLEYQTAGQALTNANTSRSRQKWRLFFVCTALILATIVAIGFAPSFFLRHVSGGSRSDLPAYLSLHGVALTSWYVLLVAQAWLIAAHRTRLHRALGVVGAVLSVFVLALSTTVVLRAPARDAAAGASVPQISLMVIGDIAILFVFAVFVALAIRFRARADIHKRLMVLASVSLVAPAIARWPGAEAALPLSVIVPQLAFCCALVLYDIATRRRLHPATGWGVLLYLVAVGVSVPLAFSELGNRLVRSLI